MLVERKVLCRELNKFLNHSNKANELQLTVDNRFTKTQELTAPFNTHFANLVRNVHNYAASSFIIKPNIRSAFFFSVTTPEELYSIFSSLKIVELETLADFKYDK